MAVFFKKWAYVMALLLLAGQIYASECVNDYWAPTFVHDVDIPDGPYYVPPYGAPIKLQGYTQQEWTSQACQFIQQYGLRNRNGFTDCYNYTRVQCGCKRGLSEGNSTCRAFLASRTPANPYNPPAQQQSNMRYDNPYLTPGYWIDRCLSWASQCDEPAASEFCRRSGYDRAVDFKWSYHAPTQIISSGQICNDPSACGGFDYITCARGAGNTYPPSHSGGGSPGASCSGPNQCQSGICLLGVCSQ